MTPPGIIQLPANVTPSAVELIRADLEPQLRSIFGVYEAGTQFLPSSYSEQLIGGPAEPETGYARYRYDLYGPVGRDWFPILNAGLLVSLVSLVVAIAAVLSGAVR